MEDKITKLSEDVQQLSNQINECYIFNICKDHPISHSSSNISITMEESPTKSIIHLSNQDHFSLENKINEEKLEEEDDELIDECYDSIPLNNVKKVTGIKSFIWFSN